MSLKNDAIIVTIAAFLLIFALNIFSSDTSTNVLTGFVFSAAYPGYAAPYSYGSVNTSLVFNSASDTVTRSVDVNDDIVYRTGYVSYDGTSWTPFDVSPSASGNLNTDWINTKGTISLSFTPSQLGLNANKLINNNTYIIIYSCSKNTTAKNWTCHDGWQIKQFNSKLKTTCTSGTETRNCTITNGIGHEAWSCNNGIWTKTGTCIMYSCNNGYQNCDGNSSNGCETNIYGTDPNNCGDCRITCTGTCKNGVCTTTGNTLWRTTYFENHVRSTTPISNIPWTKYTHVAQQFTSPYYNSSSAQWYVDFSCTEVDLTAREFVQGAHNNGAKALFSIFDIDLCESNPDLTRFAEATTPANIKAFVTDIINKVNYYGYDGVDVDWEININEAQYVDLVSRLRTALGPNKTLIAASGDWDNLPSASNKAQSYLDQINVMCYQLDDGATRSWFVDPLIQGSTYYGNACDHRIAALTNAGVAKSKIGVGIPFYGRRWTGVTEPSQTGGTKISSELYYRNLVADTSRWQDAYKKWDSIHRADYLSIPSLNEYISYTGDRFITEAVNWTKSQGYGGLMTYSLNKEYLSNKQGDARYPLSTILYKEATSSSGGGSVGGDTISCTGSANISCTTSIVNSASATRTRTCNTATGVWNNDGTCTLNSCISGYHISGNTCVVDTIVTPYCGDGNCTGTETCSSCPSDCGTCPQPTNYTRTFYVSYSTGSDTTGNGSLSRPWQTISKVNSQTFNAGDGILFKRGDTWHEPLIVKSSGSASAPITYGAYGSSGNNPIISGFITLTGWTETASGSGIFQATCPSCTTSLNMVTMNGIPKALGRTPNSGYSIFEGTSGSTSITDNQLTGTPNWAGAQIVVRSSRWTLDKATVSSHSGTTLTFSAVSHAPRSNYGYFIQKSEKTLDQLGEWYYDSSANKLKMYFGPNNPNSSTIKASNIDTIVTSSGKNYITFDHISFEGGNSAIFSLPNSGHITIQNCGISYSGRNGIYESVTPYLTVMGCNINNSLNNGIDSKDGASPNGLIKNNVIENSGRLPGMGDSGTGAYTGITNWGSVSLTIDSNKIYNTGYSGMNFAGSSNVVKNNIVDTFCTVLDDGGGIYSSYSSYYTSNYVLSKVQDNIVLNGIGSGEGTDDPASPGAEGIYMDVESDRIEISGNTVANCGDSGLFIQYTDKAINAHNNTFFNNRRQMLVLGGAVNNNIQNNIFFAKTASQLCVGFDLTGINNLGTFDYNYYARPIDDTTTFGLLWSSPRYTLQQWQSLYSLDTHSKKSPKSITNVNDILFEYNPTTQNKIITLSGNYIDVRNVTYSGSVTLKPFTSIILIKN